MDMYREQLLDHYRHPRGWGEVARADIEGVATSHLCGDELKVQLTIEAGLITDFYFTGHGCAISIASASLLHDKIVGQPLSRLRGMKLGDMESLLGFSLSPGRVKCAMLALAQLQEELSHYVAA